MTREAYLNALARLGLKRASITTARCLGISVRNIQNYSTGECPVPRPVELLLRMYLQYGIPEDLLR